MEILYSDNWLVAVNKEVGELVQGSSLDDRAIPEPIRGLFVVNRLDRPVSGLVLYGRNPGAAARFGELLRERSCLKIYTAIVARIPDPPQGTLVHWVKSDPKGNRTRIFDQPVGGAKKAVLHYRHSASTERYHFLEILLETGRHHQIRAQLSRIGCPVKGDLKYGFPRSNPGGGISLHSRGFRVIHPFTNRELTLIAPYPGNDPLWQLAPGEIRFDDPA